MQLSIYSLNTKAGILLFNQDTQMNEVLIAHVTFRTRPTKRKGDLKSKMFIGRVLPPYIVHCVFCHQAFHYGLAYNDCGFKTRHLFQQGVKT